MATQAAMVLRRALQLQRTMAVPNLTAPCAHFHSSQKLTALAKNERGLYACTMIPGHGVGPDLMNSAREVIKNINVGGSRHGPISFTGGVNSFLKRFKIIYVCIQKLMVLQQ